MSYAGFCLSALSQINMKHNLGEIKHCMHDKHKNIEVAKCTFMTCQLSISRCSTLICVLTGYVTGV